MDELLLAESLPWILADPQTFMFEIFEDGLITFGLHFADDRLLLEVFGAKLEGQLENP